MEIINLCEVTKSITNILYNLIIHCSYGMKKVVKSLEYIDFFKTPIPILNERKESTSACGGIATLVIIAISVMIFYQPTIDFATFTAYSWIESKDFDIVNPISFTDDQFFFAVYIDKNNASDSSSDISIIYSLWNWTYDESSRSISSQTSLNFSAVPCNNTLIEQYYGKPLAQKFKSYTPQLYYCPPIGFKAFLNNTKIESNAHVTISMYKTTTTTASGSGAPTSASAPSGSGGGGVAGGPPNRPESVTVLSLIYNFDLQKKDFNLLFLDRVAQFQTDFDKRVAHYSAFMGTKTLDDSNANAWPSSLTFTANTDLIYTYPYISSSSIDYSGLDKGEFGRVTIWMGNQNYKVTRAILKVDQYLSFMGGSFQFIEIIGLILILNFSSLRSLIKLGREVDLEGQGNSNNLYKQMGYCTYLKYYVKSCFCGCLCCALNENEENISKLEEYGEKVTSINRIETRLRILEKGLSRLLPDNELKKLELGLLVGLEDILHGDNDSDDYQPQAAVGIDQSNVHIDQIADPNVPNGRMQNQNTVTIDGLIGVMGFGK